MKYKMRFIFVFVCAYLMITKGIGQMEVPIFVSGEEGYKNYRIPAIVQLKSGKILAFGEGRVDHAGDFGHINIVYKTSDDGGKTWSTIQIAAKNGLLQVGNSAPIVDNLDPAYPQGRIFLFYNTGNNHEYEVRKGNGYREAWYITSVDEGKTWSEPVNITTQVHRPYQPNANPAYNFKEDWRAFANTPGHAFQFDSGPYRGRIYVGANRSEGEPKPNGRDYFAFGYYTDDHGQSFNISDKIPFEGSNESMAAQISSTGLYMNSRNQQGNERYRIISRSDDGGKTWMSTEYDKNLPDPVNQGAVLSWKRGKKYILAISNAADTQKRDNLTLRLSKDGGNTWYFEQLIAKAPVGYKGDYAAYSDIVLINKKTIGVLFEKEDYSKIVFTRIKIK